MTTSVLRWSSTADYIIWSPLYLVIIEASWTLFYHQCDEGLKSGIYLCFLCIFWQSKYCEFNSNCKIFLQLNEKSCWIFLCMNKSILKYSVEWRYCGRLPFKEGHGKSDKTNFSKHTTERLQMPILVLNFFMNSNNCTKRMRKCTWADSFVSSQDKRHPYWESTFLVQYKRKNISLITFNHFYRTLKEICVRYFQF